MQVTPSDGRASEAAVRYRQEQAFEYRTRMASDGRVAVPTYGEIDMKILRSVLLGAFCATTSVSAGIDSTPSPARVPDDAVLLRFEV